jgi:hypothetical protein
MKRLLSLGLLACGLAMAPAASAFCGFYVGGADSKLFNNATQVVLLRDGTRTVLSMQNNYEGPPSGFAMVVPVPVVLQKENVKTLPKDVFDKIDQLDAPRLVEYWEQDPCWQPAYEEDEKAMAAPPMAMATASTASDSAVRVLARFEVGEYDVVILGADDSAALEAWLHKEGYAIPQGAEPYFRPYVQAGSKFFVAKVDPQKVKVGANGRTMLSPLRFHYDSESFSLPVRLGLINAKDAQDLVVHVLAKGQRYEVANYPNVTIPTNIDVSEGAKASFGSFYAALFDATLAKNKGAVVTEYSWAASTCDPCPGPALDPSDLLTLGADVLPGVSANDPSFMWSGGGFVVTRLHARYSKDTLGADLVFRAAPPIVGGREMQDVHGKLEQGSRPDAMNNFQGRYAIRHPWTGPIACANPRRGMWGGPPPQVPRTGPVPARDTAFAPRGTIQLASLVKSNVTELDLGAGPIAGTVPLGGTAPPPPLDFFAKVFAICGALVAGGIALSNRSKGKKA